MKQLKDIILEKLKINSKSKVNEYEYFPENRKEFNQLIDELIDKRGNNADLNDIDTSKITNMNYLFVKSEFNGDISKWNVSNVESMKSMFFKSKFNGDISKWDVSNVEYMDNMFVESEFNGDISNWDVSKVKNILNIGIFKNCPLEKNPPKWYHE